MITSSQTCLAVVEKDRNEIVESHWRLSVFLVALPFCIAKLVQYIPKSPLNHDAVA